MSKMSLAKQAEVYDIADKFFATLSAEALLGVITSATGGDMVRAFDTQPTDFRGGLVTRGYMETLQTRFQNINK